MTRILVPAGLAAVVMAGLWLLVAVDRARHIIRAQLAGQNLPGLSVAVGVDGEVVWAEGYGWANIESRVPVTPNAGFRIGTASTVLTSAAAGMLLERAGRLRHWADAKRCCLSRGRDTGIRRCGWTIRV